MLNHTRFGIIRDEIIVFIIPGQRPGADEILRAAMAVLLLKRRAGAEINRPLKVPECNTYSLRDSGMQLVDVVINAFIHRLDTV